MVSFAALPRELRDLIYPHSHLIVEVEIIPYPTARERASTEYRETKGRYPSAALLRVNRQIRTEALEVVFSKNSWRLPSIPLPNYNIFSGQYSEHFRFLTVVFDHHDLSDSTKSRISKNAHSREFDQYDLHDTPSTRSADIHACYLNEIQRKWESKR